MLHGFAASPIAFISHERKQVVIQFLNIQNIQYEQQKGTAIYLNSFFNNYARGYSVHQAYMMYTRSLKLPFRSQLNTFLT